MKKQAKNYGFSPRTEGFCGVGTKIITKLFGLTCLYWPGVALPGRAPYAKKSASRQVRLEVPLFYRPPQNKWQACFDVASDFTYLKLFFDAVALSPACGLVTHHRQR
jgi:hypothetical protein